MKDKIDFPAPFSIIFGKPCECKAGKFPSPNFYILREAGSLLFFSQSRSIEPPALHYFSSERGDCLEFCLKSTIANSLDLPDYKIYSSHSRNSIKFTYEDGSCDNGDLSNFLSLYYEAAQFHIMGLVKWLNFLKTRPDLWSLPVMPSFLYDLVLNLNVSSIDNKSYQRLSSLISSHLKSFIEYFVNMMTKTKSQVFARQANIVLMFTACLAIEAPSSFSFDAMAIFKMYESLLNESKFADYFIEPASLFLFIIPVSENKEEIALKYTISRNLITFF